ncbi:MAG: 2-amino-4-hydroxy-6-hydroxymethyldihydropteridine diphosphokinase [Pirellulaceae bacterium]|nr:2-amino-4-hydroxy-6-hydroxymethyldihydropteridine diphosphokinase [Pirellulaceae bacterium]
MAKCLISLGANIGDARSSVLSAVDLLRQGLAQGDQLTLSPLYHTPPVGGPDGQASFVNAVAAIQTQHDVEKMWQLIRRIELRLGRQRIQRWEARRIDLDILLYDDLRIWTEQLKVPHPRMCMRRFILRPAADVAEQWLDPVSGLTIGTLAANLADGDGALLLVAPADQAHSQAGRDALRQLQDGVSRASGTRWLDREPLLDVDHIRDAFQSATAQHLPASDRGRIACWLPMDQFQLLVEASPLELVLPTKLIVFWQPFLSESSPPQSTAWEQLHRKLAIQLRLCPESEGLGHWRFQGARYLLATSDVHWAQHELCAALEAMDCTIWPLESAD